MSGLFGSPKIPAPPAPKPIPDEDDPRIAMARRRKVAAVKQSSGSQSTILSGNKETLG